MENIRQVKHFSEREGKYSFDIMPKFSKWVRRNSQQTDTCSLEVMRGFLSNAASSVSILVEEVQEAAKTSFSELVYTLSKSQDNMPNNKSVQDDIRQMKKRPQSVKGTESTIFSEYQESGRHYQKCIPRICKDDDDIVAGNSSGAHMENRLRDQYCLLNVDDGYFSINTSVDSSCLHDKLRTTSSTRGIFERTFDSRVQLTKSKSWSNYHAVFDPKQTDRDIKSCQALCGQSQFEKHRSTYSICQIDEAIAKTLSDISKITYEENVPTLINETEDSSMTKSEVSYFFTEDDRPYTNSPHHKRKMSIQPTSMLSTVEMRYMQMKTDPFVKSTQGTEHQGILDVAIQYLIVTERLKVSINQLNGMHSPKQKNWKSYVEIDFMLNEKINAKSTRSKSVLEQVTFDEDFYFKNIDLDSAHLLCLRFRVLKKERKFIMTRTTCVGEAFAYLDDLDILGKVELSLPVLC